MKSVFKYIYGPVPSWRLGSSLGIDLLSQGGKICNFDCLYCQLGSTRKYTLERKIYIPVEKVIEELKMLPQAQIDYITFSGRGEPTLAENLGQTIKAVKSICKIPVAVLTNSSLMDNPNVRKELALADFVIAKLDAYSPESLREINNPQQNIEFTSILDGIKEFRNNYRGKLALQIIFIPRCAQGAGSPDKNKDNIQEFIHLINYIKPAEVQVNTPLRPCNIKPLSPGEIFKIRDLFSSLCKGINIVSVYDERVLKYVLPVSDKETLKRRGKV